MIELVKRHLSTIKNIFDSDFTVNQFNDEVEVTGVKYLESWDVDDLEEPLHVVVVYENHLGYCALKSVSFPFIAQPEDWIQGVLFQLYDWMYDKFFMHEEVLV